MRSGVRYLRSQALVKKGDLSPGCRTWSVLEVPGKLGEGSAPLPQKEDLDESRSISWMLPHFPWVL